MKVIDVSKHNGTIDWNMAKSQISGAILRCGYGDNIISQDDVQFKRNADECTRLGIPFGVYIYSYAKTIDQAKSEANHVLRLVKPYKLSFPVYYDLEEKGTENGAKERAIVFGDIIEKAGYWCGIYASENWWNNYLQELERFTKWVAKYSSNKPSVSSYDIWQYTSKGSMAGINGELDISECYRDFPSAIAGKATQKATQTTVQHKYAIGTAVRVSSYYNNANDSISQAIIKTKNGIIIDIINNAPNPYKLDSGGYCNDGDIRADITKEINALQQTQKEYYTIKTGDTLTKISKEYGTSISQIMTWNRIQDANRICAGQLIRVR